MYGGKAIFACDGNAIFTYASTLRLKGWFRVAVADADQRRMDGRMDGWMDGGRQGETVNIFQECCVIVGREVGRERERERERERDREKEGNRERLREGDGGMI